ncbi:MAG: repair protein RecO [Actinomycetota bacterium]|jgi:DNA repair protein RecO (recombination protein O)
MARGTIYRDEGIVLRTYKLGEADRIVVFLTKGHGKVRAVAKGVRKTKSKFGSRLEPMSHCALQFYEGRELDLVTQAETIDHFRIIRENLEQISRGVSMLEVADQLAQEGEVNSELYKMLLGALRTLESNPSPLVTPAFFWKVLALEGFRPEVDCCVLCEATEDLVAFDFESGGVLCRRCRRGMAISPEAIQLLQLVLGGRLGEALAAENSQAVVVEVDQLAVRTVEHHLERRLRSLNVLDH